MNTTTQNLQTTTPVNRPPAPAPRRGGAGVYVGGIVLAAVLVGIGVAPRLRQHSELTQSVTAAREDKTTPLVDVIDLGAVRTPLSGAADRPGQNASDLVLPASIEAIEDTVIGARTTGYVRARYADIGSRVKAGQVLAEIESPEVDQELTQAVAQNVKSQAGTGQAQAMVSNLQAGVAQSAANLQKSLAALDQSYAARAKAKAQLAQARANVASARAAEVHAEKALIGKKADVEQNQAQLDLDKKSNDRWVDLGKQGAVAQQDVDTRISAYNAGVASLTSVQADVQTAEADVDAAKQAVLASDSAAQAAAQDVASSEQAITSAKAQITSDRAGITAARASVASGEQNVNAAQAQVGADAANVQHYADLRSFEKVVAPYTGVITQRDVDTGALITAGGTGNTANLFSIARTDTLRINANVPQTFVASVHPGQKVAVQIRELPGKTFTGIVYRTAGALDVTSRTLLTEIHVPNSSGVLLPGMYAQVRFPGLAATNAHSLPRIPSDTLISDAQGTRVATVVGGKVHFVPITIGRDYGSELEVQSGLTGKETLIENPTDNIAEGQAVRVAPAAVPTAPGGK